LTGPSPPGQDAPTVVLIGGPMTADDGTMLDSRQAVDGDPSSQVTRSGLAGSLLWWITVASVISPILDSAGDDAFALIIGNRSVTELRQDGTLKRTSLRSFLPGGTGNVELIRSADQPLPARYTPVPESPFGYVNGILGVDRGQAGRRWRFFNGNEFYLPHAGPLIAPAVVIDTSKSLMDGAEVNARQLENLHRARFLSGNMVLVLPHTHRAEALITAYHRWTARRWYGPSGEQADAQWNPDAPPDPIRYTDLVPIQADFRITGLSHAGTWQDPADLEAARRLLQARYDLKIGIWDLARNPVLRRTLLQATPVPDAPAETTPVPAAAARRAQRRVTTALDEKAARRQALAEIAAHLTPLYEQGWEDEGPGFLRLPLTPAFPWWDGPQTLVSLQLMIMSRQTEVTGFALLYNHPDIDIAAYVQASEQILSRIAAPGEFSAKRSHPVLWREAGGSADRIDWQARAGQLVRRTEKWTQIFGELCTISIEIMNGARPYP
jgi:hypothetical protein